jgi:hypothetical protein
MGFGDARIRSRSHERTQTGFSFRLLCSRLPVRLLCSPHPARGDRDPSATHATSVCVVCRGLARRGLPRHDRLHGSRRRRAGYAEEPHTQRSHTHRGATHTEEPHKQRSHTNRGATHTEEPHKQRSHTNRGATQVRGAPPNHPAVWHGKAYALERAWVLSYSVLVVVFAGATSLPVMIEIKVSLTS